VLIAAPLTRLRRSTPSDPVSCLAT